MRGIGRRAGPRRLARARVAQGGPSHLDGVLGHDARPSGICRLGSLAYPDFPIRNGIGQEYGAFQGWRACASPWESWIPLTIRRACIPRAKRLVRTGSPFVWLPGFPRTLEITTPTPRVATFRIKETTCRMHAVSTLELSVFATVALTGCRSCSPCHRRVAETHPQWNVEDGRKDA